MPLRCGLPNYKSSPHTKVGDRNTSTQTFLHLGIFSISIIVLLAHPLVKLHPFGLSMMIKGQNLHQLGVQILPQLCRDPAYWHLLTKSE